MMWPRVVEAMFGCWLAVSPFIFGHPFDRPLLWWNDLTCALLMTSFALASYHPALRHAHLLNVATAGWLIGFGYVASVPPAAPAYQNDIFVGLLLLMFAILPNYTNQPPCGWREFRG